MKRPLYIVWNKNQMIGVPIIDDQHHAMIAKINSLYFFINQGWGLSSLQPTLKVIKASVGFHLRTEEGILEKLGANHKVLFKHNELHTSFCAEADSATKEALELQDPMILLNFLKRWWQKHLNEDHSTYSKYIDSIVTTHEE